MTDFDLEAIWAELRDAHLATVAFIASDGHTSLGVRSNQEAADVAIATVRPHFEALLARIAELEAARLRNLATAEASGYERAVARLRDREAWAKWCAARITWEGKQTIDIRQPTDAADYLESVREVPE